MFTLIVNQYGSWHERFTTSVLEEALEECGEIYSNLGDAYVVPESDKGDYIGEDCGDARPRQWYDDAGNLRRR